MYSTGKYLEIAKYTNLRLRSAALRAMDDDDGVGDGVVSQYLYTRVHGQVLYDQLLSGR